MLELLTGGPGIMFEVKCNVGAAHMCASNTINSDENGSGYRNAVTSFAQLRLLKCIGQLLSASGLCFIPMAGIVGGMGSVFRSQW
jgi:hypothetical protein